MMPPHEPPDSFHVRAAHGWLGLDNHIEANEELEKITPQLRAQHRSSRRRLARQKFYAFPASRDSTRAMSCAATATAIAAGNLLEMPEMPIGQTRDASCESEMPAARMELSKRARLVDEPMSPT